MTQHIVVGSANSRAIRLLTWGNQWTQRFLSCGFIMATGVSHNCYCKRKGELNRFAWLSLSQPRHAASVHSPLFKINGMALLKSKEPDKSVCPGRRGATCKWTWVMFITITFSELQKLLSHLCFWDRIIKSFSQDFNDGLRCSHKVLCTVDDF